MPSGSEATLYAASLPGNDITPVLPQIFADMSWAGMEAIELMLQTICSFTASHRTLWPRR